jgi:hypothetical protein
MPRGQRSCPEEPFDRLKALIKVLSRVEGVLRLFRAELAWPWRVGEPPPSCPRPHLRSSACICGCVVVLGVLCGLAR